MLFEKFFPFSGTLPLPLKLPQRSIRRRAYNQANDGNYYLMGYDDKYTEIRVCRVDLMTNVRFMGEPREGKEAADQTEINKYSQQSFSMFGGSTERVTIRFHNRSMNTVFDRFGKKGAVYLKEDDEYFTITADIKISDQFFTWVCGFGRKAKIISPEPVWKKFSEFLDKNGSICVAQVMIFEIYPYAFNLPCGTFHGVHRLNLPVGQTIYKLRGGNFAAVQTSMKRYFFSRRAANCTASSDRRRANS